MTTRDLGAMPFDLTILSAEQQYLYHPQWQVSVGVPAVFHAPLPRPDITIVRP